MSVVLDPLENYPPLVVDADRVKALAVSPQFFQPIRGRHAQVLKAGGCIDGFQFPLRARCKTLKFLYHIVVEQPLRSRVAERLDQQQEYTAYRDELQSSSLARRCAHFHRNCASATVRPTASQDHKLDASPHGGDAQVLEPNSELGGQHFVVRKRRGAFGHRFSAPGWPPILSSQSSLPTALTAVLQSSVNASARGVYA